MKPNGMGKVIQGETFYEVWNIADLLRIRPQEVDKYIKAGELQSQVIDKSTMISETSLEAFLKTHSFPARWIGGDS